MRSTGKAYSKVVHRGRHWKHLGKAHADWFKEPCSGGLDKGMPEETPMEWGILASDVNNNAPPLQEAKRNTLRFRGNCS